MCVLVAPEAIPYYGRGILAGADAHLERIARPVSWRHVLSVPADTEYVPNPVHNPVASTGVPVWCSF